MGYRRGRANRRSHAVSTGITIRDKRIVIFGLGHHGGGVASARWCVQQGGVVTVYDQQPQQALRASIAQLRGLPITLQCGTNDPIAIRAADIVIKNPAVPRTAPLLQEARHIETDLSLLLRHRLPKCIAVTGTKGKTSVTSAIDYALSQLGVSHATAGNIGTSMLSVVDTLASVKILVLELSSFQLGDVRFVHSFNARPGSSPPLSPPPSPPLFPAWPDVALCTNIYPDHLNYYPSMNEYIADKCVIAAHQQAEQWLILNGARTQRQYSKAFANSGTARVVTVCEDDNKASATKDTTETARVRHPRATDGEHVAEVLLDIAGDRSRHSLTTKALGGGVEYNLAAAYAALRCAGVLRSEPKALFRNWAGVAHRMEYIGETTHIRFLNDSTATIPDAVCSAISSLIAPIYLIAGGSDKNIALTPFVQIASSVKRLFLLEGSATARIIPLLKQAGRPYEGPFSSLRGAFAALITAVTANTAAAGTAATDTSAAGTSNATSAEKAVALLSPGCASFGMFLHEFDRGHQYRQLVTEYIDATEDGRHR